MSLDALVEAVGQSLGDARQLYGPAPQAGGFGSTDGLSAGRDGVAQAGRAADQQWRGAGGSTYVQAAGNHVTALDSVIGADQGTAPGLDGSADQSRQGRNGMNTVVEDTRNGVAALAPSTDTPAGKQQLVTHLQGQLQRAKTLLQVSEQRNAAMAQMIRNASMGYRGGGGMGGGMPGMGGGMPTAMMPGGGAGGMGFPNLAALGLTRNEAARGQQSGLNLRSESVPHTPGAASIRAAINAALDVKGVTNPAARANWEAGMMTVSGRESSNNPDAVNNSDSNAAAANPSEGAFQMTRATFAAHHEPGTSTNVRDPVAQAAAFMNYVQTRYHVAADGSNLAAQVQQADPTRPPHAY